MAFQVSIPRPSVAAVTSDLWPSMSNVLVAPFTRAAGRTPTGDVRGIRQQSSFSEQNVATSQRVSLPECLDTVSLEALRAGLVHRSAPRGPSPMLSGGTTFWAPSTTPTVRAFASSTTRSYSTLTPFRLSNLRAAPKINGLSRLQQQRFLFGGPSQNMLAQKEKTANNNPNSANAQNTFYQALLRANMPAIVVERYRSAQFASNAASEAIYAKALERVGGESGAIVGQNQNLNSDQLQAIGQAVAARSHGGQIGMANKPNGTGAKEAPLYVVVEESLGNTVFRWVKFLLIFGFFTYLSLVLITILVETTGVLKNIRGQQNNEAQPEKQTVRFTDVHGCDEAKDELQELVEFLLNPERFSSLGGKLPKGVLLVGPPGTGKTLLARAVAGEAGVPFFYMSGSEFDEVYVGVGAKRVRDLFTQARSKSPAIIFIDELDAIGAKRNERDAAYVKQTLNQLLTELDGFSQTSGVIIIGATNYPQLLDKALTRPGRFDRKVVVGLPDVRGRMDILRHHMKNVQISTDVDVGVIARGTPGFSGADLENLVNQAAIHASRDRKPKVGPLDFDWAKDKIMMGAEARSRIIQDKDKLLTAYHEAGHALVAYFSRSATPLYKITIVPRGMALGITHFLPEMDTVSRNYTEYLSDIDVAMGGKAAEEMIFGPDNVTSGISADIQQATETAFTLVTRFGYSKKLGNVDLSTNYDSLSSETKQEIEAEVRRLVEEARARATKILTEKRNELEILSKALIEYETLTKEEMEKVLRGEKLDKMAISPSAPIKLPDALQAAGLNPTPAAEVPPTGSD
ncbi:Mitochondrial inner membrane i-AAA protease supercomplex subunit YME1 [Penicillium cataractarum]|uniref:Mitochondrial inner membrane i-AAA protease supercomplex subunit YME1 n=1 Tax=Penicillium cataractarum TaxID=2100454 RepID=A0A9W9SLV4_9EURO|nr:Mitochondrial inner membrane i-AAA protease supercomplex subunit YME1 [Penicillium cataractarum]KAJ5380325.1 Mitochondrial inner membrane i-AAA protease supercomplex subunit YME1 [Penicillium cataractarum]